MTLLEIMESVYAPDDLRIAWPKSSVENTVIPSNHMDNVSLLASAHLIAQWCE